MIDTIKHPRELRLLGMYFFLVGTVGLAKNHFITISGSATYTIMFVGACYILTALGLVRKKYYARLFALSLLYPVLAILGLTFPVLVISNIIGNHSLDSLCFLALAITISTTHFVAFRYLWSEEIRKLFAQTQKTTSKKTEIIWIALVFLLLSTANLIEIFYST